MPKRVSDAERIVGYFKTAELSAAKLMLQFCVAEVKIREQQATKGTQAPAAPKPTTTRASRRTNTEPVVEDKMPEPALELSM